MTIIAKAAQVLNCFSMDCTSLSVTDLTEKLRMPKANASRLLRAMRDAGILETIGETKRYRPGVMLVQLSRAYVRSSNLVERASAVIREISERFGHTGYVSIRNGRYVTAVTDHQGTKPLRVASSIGQILPASACATGRALLARLIDDEVRQLHQTELSIPSSSAPQTVDELIDRLANVRKTGISISHDEVVRGVDGIAVAVGDPTTQEAVSLCIVLPVAASDEAERQEIARALKAGADKIAAITGEQPTKRDRVA